MLDAPSDVADVFISDAGSVASVVAELNGNVDIGVFDPQLPGANPFTLTFTGTTIHQNGSFGFEGSYYALTITNADIQGNIGGPDYAGSTVVVNGCTASAGGQGGDKFIEMIAGTVTLIDTTILPTGGLTLPAWQMGGTATLRGTSITVGSQASYGWYLTGGTLDLGTSTVPGNNTFVTQGGSTTQYALADLRSSGLPPTTCSATSFDGVVPPAGVVSGPVTVTGEYEIQKAGNEIDFY